MLVCLTRHKVPVSYLNATAQCTSKQYLIMIRYQYLLKRFGLFRLRGGGGGGGGGVQAYNFGNFNYEIRVQWEGQDTSRLF